jgi:hypothetical protein
VGGGQARQRAYLILSEAMEARRQQRAIVHEEMAALHDAADAVYRAWKDNPSGELTLALARINEEICYLVADLATLTQVSHPRLLDEN